MEDGKSTLIRCLFAELDAMTYLPIYLCRLKKYEATVQRFGLQYHLTGMTKEETFAYIRHHMKVSKTESPVFAEGPMQRIFADSQGIPRVTNQICSQALLDATSKKMDFVEESLRKREFPPNT